MHGRVYQVKARHKQSKPRAAGAAVQVSLWKPERFRLQPMLVSNQQVLHFSPRLQRDFRVRKKEKSVALQHIEDRRALRFLEPQVLSVAR